MPNDSTSEYYYIKLVSHNIYHNINMFRIYTPSPLGFLYKNQSSIRGRNILLYRSSKPPSFIALKVKLPDNEAPSLKQHKPNEYFYTGQVDIIGYCNLPIAPLQEGYSIYLAQQMVYINNALHIAPFLLISPSPSHEPYIEAIERQFKIFEEATKFFPPLSKNEVIV